MAVYFFTKAELEARLSAGVVRLICDDDNSGAADDAPVDRIREDATSWVIARLMPTYGTTLLSMTDLTVPSEIKRIALDVATAYASRRHPESVRVDWKDILKQAVLDIAEHAAAKRVADSATVAPTNRGGYQTTYTATITLPREDGTGGTGDF